MPGSVGANPLSAADHLLDCVDAASMLASRWGDRTSGTGGVIVILDHPSGLGLQSDDGLVLVPREDTTSRIQIEEIANLLNLEVLSSGSSAEADMAKRMKKSTQHDGDDGDASDASPVTAARAPLASATNTKSTAPKRKTPAHTATKSAGQGRSHASKPRGGGKHKSRVGEDLLQEDEDGSGFDDDDGENDGPDTFAIYLSSHCVTTGGNIKHASQFIGRTHFTLSVSDMLDDDNFDASLCVKTLVRKCRKALQSKCDNSDPRLELGARQSVSLQTHGTGFTHPKRVLHHWPTSA